MPLTKLQKRRLALTGTVLLFLMAFYFIFDPAGQSWMPKCIFHSLTGLDCPGCGSQRMAHALMHADIAAAWNANALLLIMLPYLLFWGWIEFDPSVHPRIHRALNSPATIAIIVVLLAAWTIGRNVA